MKKYLLTIFNDTEAMGKWMAMSPEEQAAAMQDVAARYIAYTEKLIQEGRLIADAGLSMHGTTLSPAGGTIEQTDGPYVFAKEVVGGFYYFTAANLAEATEVARGCPALHFGSRVEVREEMDYPG
ncbi:MAG: hypothetical protein JNM28_10790 [Armatimonadetes bacterium]|nr:hypothetical protein [Armatimonadota bacterium]MBS1710449.1 hypothetical protein [Armatimonadota bacterium]MBX3108120.1 hypothetical protein [Fimbriimonadaceae bacterium]